MQKVVEVGIIWRRKSIFGIKFGEPNKSEGSLSDRQVFCLFFYGSRAISKARVGSDLELL